MLTPRPRTNQAEAPDTRRYPRLRRTALAHAAMRNCPLCHWRNLPVGLTYLLHRHRSPGHTRMIAPMRYDDDVAQAERGVGV
jgi:hypothetical protein